MNKLIVKNALIINEGSSFTSDVMIEGSRIARIDTDISDASASVLDAQGKCLLPGCIDDQVHFREPGLTHKADIFTESRAAVAGGVTSFMEMPNTVPPVLNRTALEKKYQLARERSAANYSFYMGASNSNAEEVLRVDYRNVCGIKIFMGSSTGDMLVDDATALERLFGEAPALIATHCEDESTIRANAEIYRSKLGSDLTAAYHPLIRSREACTISSGFAISLARRFGTRLHILHLSTREEALAMETGLPLSQKRITAEVCVHHLFYDSSKYASLGNLIKCNPAIKEASDRTALAQALKEGGLDVVATDHAPHTLEEKQKPYAQAPSGLPLVQHSLLLMVEMSERYGWDLPFIVEKMAHHPAICFGIRDRGFVREGYYADLVLLDLKGETHVDKAQLLYKCGWSPLEGVTLHGRVAATLVNGQLVYDGRSVIRGKFGMRLEFDRS